MTTALPAGTTAVVSATSRSARGGRQGTKLRLPALEHLPALDGLRVLSALAVVVYHTMGVLRPGNQAIAVILPPAAFAFFLISGFLIYRRFAAAHLSRTAPPTTARFLRSRAWRALPLWMAAVTVYLLVNGAGALRSPNDWALTYLLLQYLDRGVRYAVIGPAWALSLEWIFYLCVPFVAWAIRRGRHRFTPRTSPYRAELWSLGALFVLTFAIGPARPAAAIVMGMGLAVLDVHRRQVGHSPSWLVYLSSPVFTVSVTAGLWLLLVDYPYRPGLSVQWIEQDALVTTLWMLVAVAWFVPLAFKQGGGGLTSALGSRLFVRASVFTFGIYLWHSVVLAQITERLGLDARFASVLYLTLAGSVLAAAVTFALIEIPADRIRGRRRLSAQVRDAADPSLQDVAPRGGRPLLDGKERESPPAQIDEAPADPSVAPRAGSRRDDHAR